MLAQTQTKIRITNENTDMLIGLQQGVPNTEAEQMRPMGEGDVARAQERKGAFGEQMDLASDLDRKKAEQADAREQISAQRQSGADVGGAAGQESGPAAVEGR